MYSGQKLTNHAFGKKDVSYCIFWAKVVSYDVVAFFTQCILDGVVSYSVFWAKVVSHTAFGAEAVVLFLKLYS
jgi:hypothetical protein